MRRALLIFVGLLGTVLTAELGLRISNVWIGRHSDTMFTVIDYDEELGWKMKPNVSARIDLVDTELKS